MHPLTRNEYLTDTLCLHHPHSRTGCCLFPFPSHKNVQLICWSFVSLLLLWFSARCSVSCVECVCVLTSYTLSLNKLQSTFKVNAIPTSRKISGCRVQLYEQPQWAAWEKEEVWWRKKRAKKYSSNTNMYTSKAILRSTRKNAFKNKFLSSRVALGWCERKNRSVCQEMSVLRLVAAAVVWHIK